MKAELFRKGYKGPANVWDFEWDDFYQCYIYTTSRGTKYSIEAEGFKFAVYRWFYPLHPFCRDWTKQLRCTKIVFEDGAEYYFNKKRSRGVV